MSFRFGVGWLERTFLSATTMSEDDARSWLDGDDHAIAERRRASNLDAIAIAGGDLG